MLFKLKSTEYCVSRGIFYRNRCTCGRGTNVDFVLHKKAQISIADIGGARALGPIYGVADSQGMSRYPDC